MARLVSPLTRSFVYTYLKIPTGTNKTNKRYDGILNMVSGTTHLHDTSMYSYKTALLFQE